MKGKYGFEVGQTVLAKIALTDEEGEKVPAGTALRIVAIAPKVRSTDPDLIEALPKRFDSKGYFVNLVREEQEKDRGGRFRVNFVTIKKERTPRK